MKKENIKVSVVIPVFNEEGVISECLFSLKTQTYKYLEIIVVDDGSTDKTHSKVKNFQNSFPNLSILKQKHKGPGAGRNLGAKKARGEVLVFVDADMSFDKDFIKYLTKPIFDKKSKGTFSKEEFVSNWDNPWARCWNIANNWPEKRMHPTNYPDKQKVFRAILKSEFQKVGGFTPGGYTDDYSLYEKLKYMADSADNAVFYHKNPDNLHEVFTQARWVGKREYKLGSIGIIIALIRSSLPVSILVGGYTSIIKKNPFFLIFKLIYDLGIFTGIISFFFKGNALK